MSDATDIAVHKYGGTSLTTLEHVRHAAHLVETTYRSGRAVVVVVSARGKTTDTLLSEAMVLGGVRHGREVDQLLASGENTSAALLVLALHGRGVRAASLTGPQAGIAAVGRHGAGVITAIDTSRIRSLVGSGHVVVVSGFQGVNPAGDVITLGRGGSDTTAVALAGELGAECHIFTDVDGVCTADPRYVPAAAVLPVVDADVMAEMAHAGARVLHSRAAALAAVNGLEVVIRNSRSFAPGTTIVERSRESMPETRSFVTAIVHDADAAVVTIRSRTTNDALAANVFAALADSAVATDLVHLWNADDSGILMRFSVKRSELQDARAALKPALEGVDCSVETDEQVAKVSIVGSGLLSRPACTARMLATLTGLGIRSTWVCTTQLRTSVLVPADGLIESVAALHSAFGLDEKSFEVESVATA